MNCFKIILQQNHLEIKYLGKSKNLAKHLHRMPACDHRY
jgi:hypothetical protein